jgi:two-component system response regulator QseB
MRVLLVEDDEIVGDAITASLSQEAITVDWVRLSSHATHALKTEVFDFLVLDLGLPDGDGLNVLRSARADGNAIPALILTARDTVADRVQGLDSGADDYMIKPFDLEELQARMRSLTRRISGRATLKIAYKDLVVSPESHSVTRRGKPVKLTTGEYAVLLHLLEDQGRALTRQRLKESIYGWGCDDVDSNTIDVHIYNIRRKLDSTLIQTIRGVGYIILKEHR